VKELLSFALGVKSSHGETPRADPHVTEGNAYWYGVLWGGQEQNLPLPAYAITYSCLKKINDLFILFPKQINALFLKFSITFIFVLFIIIHL